MYKMLFAIVCNAYASGIRPLVVKSIEDPNTDWDDVALGILDRIFNYS